MENSFLSNYSNDKLSNALNMLLKFAKSTKYFKHKGLGFQNDKVYLYKLIDVEHYKVSGAKHVNIKCVCVEMQERPNDYPILNYGPKSFSYNLTEINSIGLEVANLDGWAGINALMNFFANVEIIDEGEVKKIIDEFQRLIAEQINKF